MKHSTLFYLFFLLIFVPFAALHSQIHINVLLSEHPIHAAPILTIQSKMPILITSKTLAKESEKVVTRQPEIQIAVRNNALFMSGNNKTFRKIHDTSIRLHSITNAPFIIDGNEYHGSLQLVLDTNKKQLYLINRIDLEDYLYAVLLCEIYQSWPLEMQKLQAIISRTYAIYHILQQRKQGKQALYDIKRNTFHQRYTGHHEYHHLRQAVNDTKGMILTYNNNVIISMFDACCGGSIPALMDDIDFEKAPYLARTTPCHFCKNYDLYRWHRSIPIHTMVQSLKDSSPNFRKKLKNTGPLRSVKIKKRDAAGIVRMLSLNFSNKTLEITGADFRTSMSKTIRSQCFSIKKRRNMLELDGNGFGHQIGFCQRGARELVKRGWPLKKILSFYYPQTTLAKLQVTHA